MNCYYDYLPLFKKALKSLDQWRDSYGEIPGSRDGLVQPEALEQLFEQFCKRLAGNYPFHHPSYAGQMLKPLHPAAWVAYSIVMTINPNNPALDGGPPTSGMEKEVMEGLAEMVGYSDPNPVPRSSFLAPCSKPPCNHCCLPKCAVAAGCTVKSFE